MEARPDEKERREGEGDELKVFFRAEFVRSIRGESERASNRKRFRRSIALQVSEMISPINYVQTVVLISKKPFQSISAREVLQ